MEIQRFQCGMREIKTAKAENGEMTFSGYGAVFGNEDWYGDVIQQGAFANTIAEAKSTGQWPSMLLQHGMTSDWDIPIGIWTEMKEDSIGLYIEGKLADTPRGVEAYTLLKMDPRPAINGLSIGYRVVNSTPGMKPEDPDRTLTEIKLIEISLVTFPANPKARVTDVKSPVSKREIEQALRDAGLSQSQAKAFIANGYKALSQRDADDEGEEKQYENSAEVIRRLQLNTIKLLKAG